MFILILILVFLIICSGCLSASETAFFSLSSFTLRSYKRSTSIRKRLVASLLDSPRDLLVTIMILNIGANILVQNTVSSIFNHYSSWALNVGVPLFITLFFGDVIPKSIALPNNKAYAASAAKPLSVVFSLLRPIRRLLTFVTGYVSRFLFFFLKKEPPLSYEELEVMVHSSKESGVIHSHERELITGYVDLHQSIVKEKMRPKEEIVFYDIEDPKEKLIETFTKRDCSRVPICKGGLDHILGLLTINDFFVHEDILKDENKRKKYLIKPFFVPDTTNAWSCFYQMRKKQRELALVVDEYGCVTGLITQEDLVEEVVGEIRDEREGERKYTRSSKDVIIASGSMEVEDFEELFSVTLVSEGNPVTLGGWISEQMEMIPKVGQTYETENFFFYILAAEPNRIRRIYVRNRKNKTKKRGKR